MPLPPTVRRMKPPIPDLPPLPHCVHYNYPEIEANILKHNESLGIYQSLTEAITSGRKRVNTFDELPAPGVADSASPGYQEVLLRRIADELLSVPDRELVQRVEKDDRRCFADWINQNARLNPEEKVIGYCHEFENDRQDIAKQLTSRWILLSQSARREDKGSAAALKDWRELTLIALAFYRCCKRKSELSHILKKQIPATYGEKADEGTTHIPREVKPLPPLGVYPCEPQARSAPTTSLRRPQPPTLAKMAAANWSRLLRPG